MNKYIYTALLFIVLPFYVNAETAILNVVPSTNSDVEWRKTLSPNLSCNIDGYSITRNISSTSNRLVYSAENDTKRIGYIFDISSLDIDSINYAYLKLSATSLHTEKTVYLYRALAENTDSFVASDGDNYYGDVLDIKELTLWQNGTTDFDVSNDERLLNAEYVAYMLRTEDDATCSVPALGVLSGGEIYSSYLYQDRYPVLYIDYNVPIQPVVYNIDTIINETESGFASTTGFTMAGAVAWTGDNLIKLFIGSGLSVLYELRYWIMTLIIIIVVLTFAYRVFMRHMRHKAYIEGNKEMVGLYKERNRRIMARTGTKSKNVKKPKRRKKRKRNKKKRKK